MGRTKMQLSLFAIHILQKPMMTDYVLANIYSCLGPEKFKSH